MITGSLPRSFPVAPPVHRVFFAGNAISGMAVATSVVFKEIVDNRDKVETYLAHGASRTEACIPIAREALRLA